MAADAHVRVAGGTLETREVSADCGRLPACPTNKPIANFLNHMGPGRNLSTPRGSPEGPTRTPDGGRVVHSLMDPKVDPGCKSRNKGECPTPSIMDLDDLMNGGVERSTLLGKGVCVPVACTLPSQKLARSDVCHGRMAFNPGALDAI